MSPLSNYCENTNLTPTNTCVPSSRLDILQFKMLCFLLKKTPNTGGYFTTFIISPGSVCSLDSSATLLWTVMPLFNTTHGLILGSILLNIFIISLACGSKHTFSEFADDAKCGGKMVNTAESTVQRGCGILILGDFQNSIRQVPQQPDLNSKLALCTGNWFGRYPQVPTQHKFFCDYTKGWQCPHPVPPQILALQC